MKIAFDMGGIVNSPWHTQVAQLARDLFNAGWDVYILSPDSPKSVERECERNKFPLDIVTEHIQTKDKGEACAKYGIDIFLDDNPDYLRGSLERSPMTLSLWGSTLHPETRGKWRF